MGYLVPVGCFEALPGDTIQQSSSLLIRVSPLLSPVMHPVDVRVHHFFVPNRLIWDDWEKFITGGPDGLDASEHPHVLANDAGLGTLQDYLGILPQSGRTVSALPFRAYALIWNEYFRDQDLQTPLSFSSASGSDTVTSRALQRVAWEKDYFTSARPFAQKGAGVSIPIGLSAPLTITGTPTFNPSIGGFSGPLVVGAGNNVQMGGATEGSVLNWDDPGLIADLAATSSISVRDLRESLAIQRYQEARARYGSRYTEYLAYLGVRSADSRLQRPEYLGGGKQRIQFSEVLQTGPDSSGEGVANLLGHGVGAVRSNRYRRFFQEHGIVLSLMSVRPKTVYNESLNRMWLRNKKEDYFQRELQFIGQQEVYNSEVYAKHSNPGGIFGYQDRYDEYRRQESQVSGEFRGVLNYWHYARSFSADPVLNASFVESVPTKRTQADESSHSLWVMCNHSVQARRIVAGEARASTF